MLSTPSKISSRWHVEAFFFFFFFPRKQDFMQFIFIGVFWENIRKKYGQFVVYWISPENGKGQATHTFPGQAKSSKWLISIRAHTFRQKLTNALLQSAVGKESPQKQFQDQSPKVVPQMGLKLVIPGSAVRHTKSTMEPDNTNIPSMQISVNNNNKASQAIQIPSYKICITFDALLLFSEICILGMFVLSNI